MSRRKILSIFGVLILIILVISILRSRNVALLDYWTGLAAGLSLLIPVILYWGFKPDIDELIRGKSEVVIQKNSLRLYKYPYLTVSKQRRTQSMTNTAYTAITVENIGKIKAKECEVEILLKNGGEPYRSKVLSSLSADSQGRPNPKTVSIDGNHETMGFHPLALNLGTLQAFLPNHSLGVAGEFTGPLVKHDGYEIHGKTIYDGKQSEIIPLGKIKIPDDFLKKSEIPPDIQVIIDQGGFAVYLELTHDKIRAKFYGHKSDKDVIGIIIKYLEKIPQIDNIFEDNGRLRRWELIGDVPHLHDVKESSS
jgi:hypothetical protein